MKPAEKWARECVEGEPHWPALGETGQEERIARFIRAARNEALEEAALEAAKACIGEREQCKAATRIGKLKDEP